MDLGADDGVDLLEVDVADAVGMARDDGSSCRRRVGDVPGVEAQRHGLRVGESEEAVDLLVVVDVASACGWNIWRTPDSSSSTLPSSDVPGRRGCSTAARSSSAGSRSSPVCRSVYIAGSSDQVRRVHRGEQGGDLPAVSTSRRRVRPGRGAGRCRRRRRSVPGRGGRARRAAVRGRSAGSRRGRARRRCSRPRRPRRGSGARAPASGRRGTRRPRSRGRCRAGGSAGWVWSWWLSPRRRSPRASPGGGREHPEVTPAAIRWFSGCCWRRSRRSCRCWWRRRTTGRSASACHPRCRCRWSAAATASRRPRSPAGRAAGRRRTRPSCP